MSSGRTRKIGRKLIVAGAIFAAGAVFGRYLPEIESKVGKFIPYRLTKVEEKPEQPVGPVQTVEEMAVGSQGKMNKNGNVEKIQCSTFREQVMVTVQGRKHEIEGSKPHGGISMPKGTKRMIERLVMNSEGEITEVYDVFYNADNEVIGSGKRKHVGGKACTTNCTFDIVHTSLNYGSLVPEEECNVKFEIYLEDGVIKKMRVL